MGREACFFWRDVYGNSLPTPSNYGNPDGLRVFLRGKSKRSFGNWEKTHLRLCSFVGFIFAEGFLSSPILPNPIVKHQLVWKIGGVKALIFLGWSHGSNRVKVELIPGVKNPMNLSRKPPWMTPLMCLKQKKRETLTHGQKEGRKISELPNQETKPTGNFWIKTWGWVLREKVTSTHHVAPYCSHFGPPRMLTGNSNTEGDGKVYNNLFEQNASFMDLDGFVFRCSLSSSLKMRIEIMKDEGWLKYVSFLQKLFSKNPQKGCSCFCWSLDFQLLLGFKHFLKGSKFTS